MCLWRDGRLVRPRRAKRGSVCKVCPSRAVSLSKKKKRRCKQRLYDEICSALYAVGAVPAGGAAFAAAAALSFTRSFNSLLGLKKGIFLAGTSTRSPVLGLRPTRGLR